MGIRDPIYEVEMETDHLTSFPNSMLSAPNHTDVACGPGSRTARYSHSKAFNFHTACLMRGSDVKLTN